MTQRDRLRSLDARIMRSMNAAGLADSPLFWPKGAEPDTPGTPCDVYVDRDVRMYGEDDAEVPTKHIVLTLFLAQVQPHRGATVVLGDEIFKLDAEVTSDESRARWVVLQ